MDIDDFISRWRFTEGSERANKDSFLKDLCRVLGVPEPDGRTGDPERDSYVFEADAVVYTEGERRSTGKMDLYRRGCFVIEAKQCSSSTSKKARTARRGTPGWHAAMEIARGQAFRYARTLDNPPPFVIVVDIGYCLELHACFDGSGAYRPYPNAQRNHIFLTDLPRHVELLRSVWMDPTSLDPTRQSERVTRDIAASLAELARELETSGYSSERVAKFLMRCIFCMFAEDIGLLRDQIFTRALETTWLPHPTTFKDGVEELWAAMNEGKRFFTLGKLLRFNGGLFAHPEALSLTHEQLLVLHSAARHDWAQVEPAIFGILIERALNPDERHKLGAHFTPTAYVDRILAPTIEEPLRAEWDRVRVVVRSLIPPGEATKPANVKKAREAVRAFHHRLCELEVLDPACGSGNFLYLALNAFKRLESEVLATLYELGVRQGDLLDGMTVTPRQFRGIEVREGSKAIAELVLWIGYLQWHHKMYGQAKEPPEPVLRDYQNIECRDALVAPRKREAVWPRVDFIIGNPPFIGKSRRRSELGDEYLDTLAEVYGDMPKGVDYVMYWWHKAAKLVAEGSVQRFGFISTKGITQALNRRVVAQATDPEHGKCSLLWAIPNHPWVDSQTAAAVRIAMTVVGRVNEAAAARLATVVQERETEQGEAEVVLEEHAVPRLHPDLRAGVNVLDAQPLRANNGVCSVGLVLFGQGFVVDDPAEVGNEPALHPFLCGRDFVRNAKPTHIIDFYPMTDAEARASSPNCFQRVVEKVRPGRRTIRDKSSKERWWRFGRDKSEFRNAVASLERYIVTCETSRHRFFAFVDACVRPENTLIAFALSDAFFLGVLSSRVHQVWALSSGSRHGVGNDPRYNRSKCFDPFPFPHANTAVADRIRSLAEEIDRHRKRTQDVSLTDMYSTLEKLRVGAPLDEDEIAIKNRAHVATLGQLHEDLDAAVLSAYGWPAHISDEEIVEHLVALNLERATEEQSGLVRWLRDDIQKSGGRAGRERTDHTREPSPQLELPWPSELPDQVAAVHHLILSTDSTWAANDVAKVYKGATAKGVVPALRTLEALGLAACLKRDRVLAWKGLAKTTGQRTGISLTSKVASSHPPPTMLEAG